MSKYDYRQNHFAHDGNEPISPTLVATWRQYLLDQYQHGYNLLLTLNYNRPRSISDVHRDVRHAFARLNRATLGPRWLTDERRWRGYVVIEHPDTNIHVHALTLPALFCRDWQNERTASAIRRAWQPIAPAGSIDIKPITKKPRVVISYLLKERGRGALTGLIVV
ncbi:hypothetical protein V6B08_15745 [Ferrovibrio sp. MS7]|uniref:hypothetical protein n=1 Tax=Ferrovibrio plantarum TaxID=3119164 RepID=UPI0031363587